MKDALISATAAGLAELEKGYLPRPIFLQVARLVVTPTIEVTPFRAQEDRIEVFLTRRPNNDEYWPGMWHIPGTVVRSTDAEGDFRTGFRRVLKDELGGAVTFLHQPRLVMVTFQDVARGRELDSVHYVEVEVKDERRLAELGKFFDVSKLPDATLAHHKEFIPRLVRAFKQHRK